MFEDVKDDTQLQYLRSLGLTESLNLRIKSSAKQKLVLQHCRINGIMDSEIAMNYNEFASELADLGMRVGFRDLLRPYNLRRGTANAIEGKQLHQSLI